MEAYRVSWTETGVFNTEVAVDDYATEDDIINEAACLDELRKYVSMTSGFLEVKKYVE